MNPILNLSILGAIALTIGTGLNNLLPGFAYVVAGLGTLNLLLQPAFMHAPHRLFVPRMIAGAIVFNVFFLLHSKFSLSGTRIYFEHFLSLGMLLLAYGYATLTLLERPSGRPRDGKFCIALVAAGALLVLLLGQLAEMGGYVDMRSLGLEDADVNLLFRPGGFQNSNMTAAIALVFLFVVARSNWGGRRYLAIAAPLLASAVVILSQSRAAIVVLVPVLLVLLWRHGMVLILLPTGAIAVLAWFGLLLDQQELVQLIETTFFRFEGDFSSDQRLFELASGLTEFANAPVFGNGYRHLTSTIGSSSHNEIVENLVNFGIVGALIVFLAFWLLYWPFSIVFLVMCLVPTFVFSHNFFETFAFQVSLGLALAVDRMKDDPTHAA